jgi:Ca-activated chloride channel homolog
MPAKEYPVPEQLYRQGVEQFSRAEWRGAIDTLSRLKELTDQYPDVDDLIADARLKLQFDTAATLPPAMAPPRRPVLLPFLAAFALLLIAASAYGFYYLNSTAPETVAAAPTLTPEPPTATPEPPTPTVAPTAEPTPAPTEAAILPATVVVTAEAAFVNTPANIEFIVDASGSMLAQVPGTDRQRWQIAQEALNALVASGAISEQSLTVVRTYGRNRGNDCSDVEVLQPLSRFNRDALLSVISTIQPAVGGMTPLGASLRAANEDLQAAEGSTVIILVTDGLESCNGDPVAEASSFVDGTDQRKVHVIGFGLERQEESDNLRRIADAGRGLYLDAADSAQLAEALRQTIVLSYQIVNADGEAVATGEVGGTTQTLDPGTYLLKVNTNPPIEKELVVPSGGNVVVNMRQCFGGLIADIKAETP